jgi:aryl-alcohol dehydrogenase-like predicted oxidoreductase
MKYRTLGHNLKVSAVGLGCMGMSHAYGAPADKEEMKNLIAKAVDMGYTLFDTAETYGTEQDPHDNEKLVGAALKPYRDKVVISTKFGIHFDLNSDQRPYPLITDSRPERIRKSVEESLKRLQTDHIDIYWQHRVDPKVPVEEVAETMADLMKEGKILNWGISEANADVIRRAHAVCPLTAVQNRYSMMARWHESLFPLLEELGIGFVAFSPMANGFLTGKYVGNQHFDARYDYRAAMPQFKKENQQKNQQLLDFIHQLADKHQATPAQISLAWMICKRPWIVPIPGTRKLERLKENAGAADVELSIEEVTKIDQMLDQIPMSDVFGGSKIQR